MFSFLMLIEVKVLKALEQLGGGTLLLKGHFLGRLVNTQEPRVALNSGETAALWFLIRKIKAYTAEGKVSRGKMETFGDSGCPGWGQETTTKSCIPCKETGTN